MRQHKNKAKQPLYLKRRLMAAMCMLLVSSLLLGVTSYAWLVMSTAPEVSGMTANIGANGSLEIALLNSETRQNLDKISNSGGSLAANNPSANNTWGNIIDLSYDTYGLHDFILWPARLQAVKTGDGYVVNSGLLSVPTYGYDGRIIKLDDTTVSGPYNGENFVANLGTQEYGVRVIGTSNNLTVQEAALALAKSNITTYSQSANSAAKASLSENGTGLLHILLNRNASYDEEDLNVLLGMIADLQNALSYIDLSLRHGMIAYAASEIRDVDDFNTVQQLVLSTGELSEILEMAETQINLPATFESWVTKVENDQGSLHSAKAQCLELEGGTYTWEQFKEPLAVLMNMDGVYINDDKFADFDTSKAPELMNGEVMVTLANGSGVFANVSDFTGDYSTTIQYITDITITTSTACDPTHLKELSDAVSALEPAGNQAGGDGTEATAEVELTDTFGYAVDLAFRCNAAVSDLLLQTTPEQRVQGDNETVRTMGGGSYMEFTTDDETFTLEQMLRLMDAARVAFIDDQGNLLGIAKLNITNRTVSGGKVKAPLYLYTYQFNEETGALEMLERQKTNNIITPLAQNIAKAVTVLVWLDGDVVDNTMVSATEESSLRGTLNLQFSSSANLISSNGSMVNITANKAGLIQVLADEEETYLLGGAAYTTVSWEAYKEAYEYAQSVNLNASATEHQIYMATAELAEAKAALEPVSKNALNEAIGKLREAVGQSDKLAGIVLEDENGRFYVHTGEYTQEQWDTKQGEILQVDYNKNLHDEGNGVFTPIYSDESWQALAAALYNAEALALDPDAVDEEINDAITTMDVVQKALQRTVFYVPYELNDVIYYKAISEDEDTYGLWYDSAFKRIVSDKTILDLDNKAKLAEVAVIEQDKNLKNDPMLVTPYIAFLDDIYPAFSEEEILAVHWNLPDLFVEGMTVAQIAQLKELIAEAKTLNVDEELITSAEDILDGKTSAANADTVIAALQLAIEDAQPEEEIPDGNPDGEAPAENPYMTDEQRIVLTAASSAAKAVDGYQNQENKDLDGLRDATEAVDLALASNETTKDQADTLLERLNEELKKLGQKEVTAYNTLVIGVPDVHTGRNDVAYVVNTPNATLYLTGETGTTTITATVLTKTGILFTASKEVTVYQPAAGVEIIEPAGIPLGGGTENAKDKDGNDITIWNHEIKGGYDFDLSAELFCFRKEVLDEDGNVVTQIVVKKNADGSVLTDGDGNPITAEEPVMVDIPHDETIKSITWASSNSAIARIENADAITCRVKAVSQGEVKVTVTIATYQGNQYAASMTVKVLPAPAEGIHIYSGDTLLDTETTGQLFSGESDQLRLELFRDDGQIFSENVVSYHWYSEKPSIVKLTGADSEAPTLQGRNVGSAIIRVEVRTDLGTTYSASTVYHVTEAEQAGGVELSAQGYRNDGMGNSYLVSTYLAGDQIHLNAALYERTLEDGDAVFEIPFYEKIVSAQWECSTPSVADILSYEGNTCIVQAQEAGKVKVTVTVVTDCGNTYTNSMILEISES